MTQYRTVGIAVLALVVVGATTYLVLQPQAAQAPLDTTTGATDPGSYSEKAAYYEIDASYATVTPLREGAGTRADAVAVALMKDFVTGRIAQFKKDGDFANLTPADAAIMGLGEDRKWALEISYLSSNSSTTVSYVFNIYEDTGGAHGNKTFKTFTFNLQDGKALALSDLFVLNAPYLAALSTLARTELPKLLGEDVNEDMITDGTTPEAKSFEHFFLDGASLVLLFPPYAVAAYAAGPQTLAIPTTELKTILKPEYQ